MRRLSLQVLINFARLSQSFVFILFSAFPIGCTLLCKIWRCEQHGRRSVDRMRMSNVQMSGYIYEKVEPLTLQHTSG